MRRMCRNESEAEEAEVEKETEGEEFEGEIIRAQIYWSR